MMGNDDLKAETSINKMSIFSKIKQALAADDYDTASDLMVEMSDKMDQLTDMYYEYSHNAF